MLSSISHQLLEFFLSKLVLPAKVEDTAGGTYNGGDFEALWNGNVEQHAVSTSWERPGDLTTFVAGSAVVLL